MDPLDDMERALDLSHTYEGQRSLSVASSFESGGPQREKIDGEKERLETEPMIGSSEFPDQNNKGISVVLSRDEILAICSTLAQSDDRSKLRTSFLQSIPTEMQPESVKESLLRARIDTALEERNFSELFSLIKNNQFEPSSHQVLQEIWYEGHYLETESVRGRTLSPVDRYRLRKKYSPPQSIWDGEQTLYSFKVEARQLLQNSYTKSRYPSFAQKQVLTQTTGLNISQINNWFKNRRHRERPTTPSSSSLTTASTALQSYRRSNDSRDELNHSNELEGNCIVAERHLQDVPNIQQNYELGHVYEIKDVTQGSRLQRIPNLQLQPNYELKGIYNNEYITPGSHLQNIQNLQLRPNCELERIDRSEDLTQRCRLQNIPSHQANYGIERLYNKEDIMQGTHLHNIPNIQPQPTYRLEGTYKSEDFITGSHLKSIPHFQLRPNYGLGPYSNQEDLMPTRYLQTIQGQLQGNYELDRIYGRETSAAPPSRVPLAPYNPRASDNGNIHTSWQNQLQGWR